MTFHSIDPATEERIRSTTTLTAEEIFVLIAKADAAQKEWSTTSIDRRIELFKQLRHMLLSTIEHSSQLITTEMGKPLTQSKSEIEKCATIIDHVIERIHEVLRPQSIASNYPQSRVYPQPMGIVLAIMPWNFPYWQFLRFAIPALAVGNGVMLKHAPSTLGCAEHIEQLFLQAGFPEHLVTNAPVDTPLIRQMIAHKNIRGVTFTGSTRAGASVASAAGQYIKKTVLELGGSDAYVVLADADIQDAARKCAESRVLNSGQSCIAAKRFIVEGAVSDAFLEAFIEEMKTKVVGPPDDPSTIIGPLARRDLRDGLADQVRRSLSVGARIAWQAPKVSDIGWYIAPMVLTHVEPGNTAFDEELFGPVAAIVSARDARHALELANMSKYGLGGAVFTNNEEHVDMFVSGMECGTIAVNEYVRSDARLPFGGVKDSGFGREMGDQGMLEFVSLKTVMM